MKHKRGLLIFLGIFLAVVIVVTAVLVHIGWNSKIDGLPNPETVMKVELEVFQAGRSVNTVHIEDSDEITAIVAMFSGARMVSKYGAMNDSPSGDYLRIDFDDGRYARYSLYQQGDVLRLYVPYIGIYRIDQKTSTEIYQKYMAN